MLSDGFPSQSMTLSWLVRPRTLLMNPLRRVHLLPDEADDRQRQDDRDEERALVDPRAAHLTVQQDGEEDPDRRGDEDERQQPQDVVPDGRPEERIRREQLLVVLQADEVLRGQRADPTPVRERQAERGDRRQPDECEAQEGRDADHQRHRHLVGPGQHRVAPTLARSTAAAPPAGGTGRAAGFGCVGPDMASGYRQIT